VLQLSYVMGNPLLWDYTPPPLNSWIGPTFEADIGFKLPTDTRLFYGRKPPKKRRSASEVSPLRRSERLELFRNIEGFLDV